MKFCLGATYTEERYFRTRQFLEAWFATTKTPITPREINKTLNRLVALLIQWEDSTIPFETLAYYSINRELISDEIESEVARDDHPLARLEEDWARQVAAVHFGVGIELAGQVLMTDPVKWAILDGDPDYVEPYRKVTGYGDILEQVTANLPTDELHPSPDLAIIGNAARLLALESGNEVPHALAWKNLIVAFVQLQNGAPYKPFATDISLLADHVDAAEAADFVLAVERVGDTIVSNNDATAELIADLGIVGTKAIELSLKFATHSPVFDVGGSGEKYLQRLMWLRAYPIAMRRLRTSASHDAVIEALITHLTDEISASAVPSLIKLFTSASAGLMLKGSLGSLDKFLTAAEQAARSTSGDQEVFRAAILALEAPSGFEDERRSAFQRLVADGTIGNNLAAAVTADDDTAVAIMVAALVWQEIDAPSPAGHSWNALLDRFPGITQRINALLDGIFGTEFPLQRLRNNYDAGHRVRELITALVEDRVRRADLGDLEPAKILEDTYGYSRMMRWQLKEEFARQLAEYQRFWPNIQTMPWSPSIFVMANLLGKRDDAAASRIRAELSDRVHSTTEEEWRAVIEEGSEPFQVVTKFLNADDLKLGVGSTLLSTLISSASKAASEGKAVRSRWLQLVGVLSAPARRKGMEAMGAVALGLPVSTKLSLLKAGGLRLLHEGGFARRADETINRVVVPLARSGKGRAWLSDRSGEIRKVVDASSAQGRHGLVKLVTGYLKSADSDQSHWAEMAKKAWGLKTTS